MKVYFEFSQGLINICIKEDSSTTVLSWVNSSGRPSFFFLAYLITICPDLSSA